MCIELMQILSGVASQDVKLGSKFAKSDGFLELSVVISVSKLSHGYEYRRLQRSAKKIKQVLSLLMCLNWKKCLNFFLPCVGLGEVKH